MRTNNHFWRSALLLLSLVTLFLSKAYAVTVNLADYDISASGGQTWTYTYTDGPSTGTSFNSVLPIFNLSDLGLTGSVETDIVIPFETNINVVYQLQNSLTVDAGTYNNVLVLIFLDENYSANSANTTYGIDAAVDQGVTEVIIYAANTGAIQFTDIGASNGGVVESYELSGLDIPAETIRFVDYFFEGADGDTWTYNDNTNNMPFDFTLSTFTSGSNMGRRKIGNDTAGIIFDVTANIVTWYEIIGEEILDPAFSFPEVLPVGQETGLDLVILKLDSYTVTAGTFNDVIVHVWLDSNFGPNSMNTTLGLGAITASAVTDVDWYANGVGLLKHYGVDASTGNNDGVDFELTSYDSSQPANSPTNGGGSSGGGGSTNPILVMMLLCLALIRRKLS